MRASSRPAADGGLYKLARLARRGDLPRFAGLIEALEPRRLLSATVVSPIAPQTVAENTPSTIDLSNNFADPQFTGTVVQFQTSVGTFDAQLFDQQTPQTVANFLQYVNLGLYNGSIIHRVTTLANNGISVIQGGGFYANGAPIQTFPPVPNEFQIPNTLGTIAMAKPGNSPDGATSQWFVNTDDNSTALDDPTNDGGFTVFGQILQGLPIAQAIDALPTADGSSINPQFDASVPVITALPAGTTTPPATDLVQMNVSVVPKVTYAATSDNLQLVNPTVSGSQLSLNPAPGRSGFCHVTVVGTDLFGNKASDTILVEVAGVPARTLNVTLGAGQPRTLIYKQSDGSIGNIHLGGPGSAVVQLTGDAIRVNRSGGWHVTGQNVQVMGINATGTTASSTLTARGHGHLPTITLGSVITNGAFRSVIMTRTLLQGNLTAPGGIGYIKIEGATGGTIDSGAAIHGHKLYVRVGTWIDESLISAAPISTINAIDWANSDTASESVQAPYIGRVRSTGSFTPGLQLSGVGAPHGRSVGVLNIKGYIGGTWNFPGSPSALSVGGISSDFNGTFTTPLRSLNVRGNFGGSLTAPSIGTINVRGSMFRANLKFTSPYSAKLRDLGRLAVRGDISGTSILSAGSIGTISAATLSQTSIYAGVTSLPAGQALPQTAADFASPAGLAGVDLHPKKKNVGFTSSIIAAAVIGQLRLVSTTTNNAANTFGIAAHSLGSFTARDTTVRQTFSIKNITSAAQLSAIVASKKLTLGDLKISIV